MINNLNLEKIKHIVEQTTPTNKTTPDSHTKIDVGKDKETENTNLEFDNMLQEEIKKLK